MLKKTFSPARILYLFASLFLYFLRAPPTTAKYLDKQFNITIPETISDIKNNTFIFIDVSLKYDFTNVIGKCLKYGNVAFLKIDNINRANIVTKLGFTKLEGVFYYKNENEIYDFFQRKPLERFLPTSEWVRNWDVLILSSVVEFKAFLEKIGITRRFFEEIFKIILKHCLK